MLKRSGPKKNLEKSAFQTGKTVTQFRNKQQRDKISKNKSQQANKVNRKRKFQTDYKSDGLAVKKQKWDDFKKNCSKAHNTVIKPTITLLLRQSRFGGS